MSTTFRAGLAAVVIAAASTFTLEAHAQEGVPVAAKASGPGALAADAAQTGARSKIMELFTIPMVPLWLCSIVLVALIFERAKALKTANVMDPDMVEEVTDLAGKLQIDKAQQVAEGSGTVVGDAWSQGLKEFQLGGVPIQEALTNATALAFKPLKRNLQIMGTIAGIAPLLGLLGTIIGMIMVFDQISVAGGADKSKLAEGIMVALFTTAFGLIVAIPGIIFNRYFGSRVQGFAERCEGDINRIKYRYSHARSKKGGAAAADGDEEDVPVAAEA
jgi:biopolymer transport protein ExbB